MQNTSGVQDDIDVIKILFGDGMKSYDLHTIVYESFIFTKYLHVCIQHKTTS